MVRTKVGPGSESETTVASSAFFPYNYCSFSVFFLVIATACFLSSTATASELRTHHTTCCLFDHEHNWNQTPSHNSPSPSSLPLKFHILHCILPTHNAHPHHLLNPNSMYCACPSLTLHWNVCYGAEGASLCCYRHRQQSQGAFKAETPFSAWYR